MSDKTLADLFAEEPADGTRLAVWREGEPPIVVERDDRETAKMSDHPTHERWLVNGRDSDPMTFEVALTDATMVHAVVPLAQSGLVLVDEGES